MALKRLVLLLIVLPAVLVAAGEEHAPMPCRLGPRNSITTWLISEPIPASKAEGFGIDYLAAFGGEAGITPTEGEAVAGDSRIKWTLLMDPGGYVNLAETCPRQSDVVFYLFCRIQPEKPGRYRLICAYWAEMQAWLGGRLVLEGKRTERLSGVGQAGRLIDFKNTNPLPLVVKLGSMDQQCLMQMTIDAADGPPPAPGVPAPPAPVLIQLPVKPETKEDAAGWLVKCITMRVQEPKRDRRMNRRATPDFVEPGQVSKLAFTIKSGRPVFEGELQARVAVFDTEGERLQEFDPLSLTPQAMSSRNNPPAIRWKLRRTWNEPYYDVRAEFLIGRRSVGRIDRKFFSPTGVEDYGNKLLKRVKKFHDKGREDGSLYTDDSLAYIELKLEESVVLLTDLHDQLEQPVLNRGMVEKLTSRIIDEVTEACDHLDELEAGRKPKRPVHGQIEYAYISKIDDMVQPYYAYVPRSYNGTRQMPLIVYLHGYAPDLNKVNWILPPQGLLDGCEKHGYLMVAPFARSNTDFQSIGELDVMHVLQLAKKRWKVDEDRVFLLGYSMGGMGAWTVGAHYPDQFAGVVALSARNDWYLWHGYARDKIKPFKRHLIDMEFASGMFENFRNLPVLCYFGTNDTLIKPQQSLSAAVEFKALGFDFETRPLAGEDHWIADIVLGDDGVFQWMAKHSRPEAPRRVSYKTWSLRYRKAYWTRIDEFIRWGEPASVDAQITDEGVIEMKTSNVASMSFYPPAKLLPAGQRPKVTCNGKAMDVMASGDGGWRISMAQLPAPPTGLRKNPDICGPAKDAYNSRFIFVWGSQGNLREDKRIKNIAKYAAKDWANFTRSFRDLLTIVKDEKVTDEQRKNCNLILFGSIETNSIIAELARKLPIKVERGKFTVGRKVFEGPRLGLVMVYPNPDNPKRYIYIQSGLFYGTAIGENHKFDLLPDFIVYSNRIDKDDAFYDRDDSNSALCAGFFDVNWQLNDRLTWYYDGKDGDRFAPPVDLRIFEDEEE